MAYRSSTSLAKPKKPRRKPRKRQKRLSENEEEEVHDNITSKASDRAAVSSCATGTGTACGKQSVSSSSNCDGKSSLKSSLRDYLRGFGGPAFENYVLCDDNVDTVSLQKIWYLDESVCAKRRIPSDEIEWLFSYRDSNGFIRAFNVETMVDMISANKKERECQVDGKVPLPILHPLTRLPLSERDVENAKAMIDKLVKEGEIVAADDSNLLFRNCDLESLSDDLIGKYTFVVFQKFTLVSIHIDERGSFVTLPLDKLVTLRSELEGMFVSNFSPDVLCSLSPSTGGSPFKRRALIDGKCSQKHQCQHRLLVDLEEVLDSSRKYPETKYMVPYVVVGALSIVSEDVRERYMGSIDHEFTVSFDHDSSSSAQNDAHGGDGEVNDASPSGSDSSGEEDDEGECSCSIARSQERCARVHIVFDSSDDDG